MTWHDPWGSAPTQQDASRRRPAAFLPVLWRYRWMLVAAAVAAGVAAYGLSLLQPTRYSATAEMILADPRSTSVFNTQNYWYDPDRHVRTQAQLVESTPVLLRVAEMTGGALDVEELRNRVRVRAIRDLDLITIDAKDPTAEGARQLADAVAAAYQAQVRAEVERNAAASIAEITESKTAIDAQITALESAIAANPNNISLQSERDAAVAQSVSLDSRIRQISVDAALYGSGVLLVEPARLPTHPSQPVPVRNAALGAILGILIGGGYAWWLGERRRVASSRHDPASILGAPLLGVIPHLESVGATTKVPTISEPTSVAAEAYHFVASSLEHSIDAEGASVILVTSPTPSDGKTVTAFNVAVAIARGGRSVLLVDADERARGLTRWNRLDDARGLTDLGNGITVDQVRKGMRGDGLALSLIPAGTRIEQGAGFFRSVEFRRTMTALRDAADVVVIDSPPILAVADALAVAGRADGVVLVITQGAPFQAIEDTRDRLAVVGTPLLGYVFNRARTRGKSAGYGYGYGREESRSR